MHSKRMYSRYTQREHGGHKHDNAGMHSASTKHGPVHPRDVDDDVERMAHDLSERCTSAPHAQHEGAQLEHGMHRDSARPGPGQDALAQRQHSGPFYGIEIRRPDFYLTHLLQKGAHIYYRFRSKFLGERAVHLLHISERTTFISQQYQSGGNTGVILFQENKKYKFVNTLVL